MRQRKHARPNQRRKLHVRSARRDQFLKIAIGVIGIIAIAIIGGSYASRATDSLPKQETTTSAAKTP